MISVNWFCILPGLVTRLILLQPVSHRLGCLHHVLQLIWVWCGVALQVSLLVRAQIPQNLQLQFDRSGTWRSEMLNVECANLVDSMPHRHTSQWYKIAQQLLLLNHCRKWDNTVVWQYG